MGNLCAYCMAEGEPSTGDQQKAGTEIYGLWSMLASSVNHLSLRGSDLTFSRVLMYFFLWRRRKPQIITSLIITVESPRRG